MCAVVSDVWAGLKSKEAKQRDKNATKKLIEIVSMDKIQEQLADKKLKKAVVWNEIGAMMKEAGFPMDNAGAKCNQKWRNLEFSYKDYMQNSSTADGQKRKLPEYFELLQRILGEKHNFSLSSSLNLSDRLISSSLLDEQQPGNVTLDSELPPTLLSLASVPTSTVVPPASRKRAGKGKQNKVQSNIDQLMSYLNEMDQSQNVTRDFMMELMRQQHAERMAVVEKYVGSLNGELQQQQQR